MRWNGKLSEPEFGKKLSDIKELAQQLIQNPPTKDFEIEIQEFLISKIFYYSKLHVHIIIDYQLDW